MAASIPALAAWTARFKLLSRYDWWLAVIAARAATAARPATTNSTASASGSAMPR